MPIRLMKTKAAFEGVVRVEEADGLQAWLIEGGARRVELARCTHLHPSSLQVLLCAHVSPASLPEDPDLAAWVAPLFPDVAP
jgi:hypothetical protein